MTGTRDRFGELIEPLDDDRANVVRVDANTGEVPRSPGEIRQHCAELRAVLAVARARRVVQR